MSQTHEEHQAACKDIENRIRAACITAGLAVSADGTIDGKYIRINVLEESSGHGYRNRGWNGKFRVSIGDYGSKKLFHGGKAGFTDEKIAEVVDYIKICIRWHKRDMELSQIAHQNEEQQKEKLANVIKIFPQMDQYKSHVGRLSFKDGYVQMTVGTPNMTESQWRRVCAFMEELNEELKNA